MITAVDTNVLLDVLGADRTYGQASKQALRSALQEGRVIACDVVWAETASFFPSGEAATVAFADLEVEFSAIDAVAATAAGAAWKAYRLRGGERRERVVADFLIGAHALHQAERLLTRDRGFYRSYYSKLAILEPSV